VIDWEDAAIGCPLADLANARLELLWAAGGEAMEEFTRRYTAMEPVESPTFRTGISGPIGA
jgi:aminoglycoside phosphotransferase (APT) family kinase protein